MNSHTAQDFIPSAARAMARSELQIGLSGYSITHSYTPYSQIAQITKSGKSYLTPVLSPSENDLCETDYSWLTVYKEETAIACLGLRRYSLGTEEFSDFWTRTMNRHYGTREFAAVQHTSKVLDREITKDCVYFGDLFVSQDISGFKLFTNLVHYGVAYATLKWNPTCLFAFITKENFNRGIKTAFGFTMSIPGVVEWNDNPDNRRTSEVCIILPHQHVASVFENHARTQRVSSRE